MTFYGYTKSGTEERGKGRGGEEAKSLWMLHEYENRHYVPHRKQNETGLMLLKGLLSAQWNHLPLPQATFVDPSSFGNAEASLFSREEY